MKRNLIICILVLCTTILYAQQITKPSEYHFQKKSLYELLPVTSDDIVFLGNSITDGGEWAELFDNKNVKNRGISADRTYNVLERLDPIIKGAPKKVFLLIGINDLGAGFSSDVVLENTAKIIDRFQKESPRTKLYIQSILPVNNAFEKYAKRHGTKAAEIKEVNNSLIEYCKYNNVIYIDISTPLSDSEGRLNAKYTNDGLHLMGEGYLIWRDTIKEYVK